MLPVPLVWGAVEIEGEELKRSESSLFEVIKMFQIDYGGDYN